MCGCRCPPSRGAAARRRHGRFCQQHPGLTVEMSLDNRFVNLVEEGFDLVIRTGYLDDSSLIARHILDSQWVICAAPPTCVASGRRASRRDLLTHNCLRYAYQSTGPRVAFKGKMATTWCRCRGASPLTTPGPCAKAALGARHRLRAALSGLSRPDERRSGGLVSGPGGQEARIYAVYPLHPPAAAQDKVAYRAYPPALPRHRPLLRVSRLAATPGVRWQAASRLAERNARDWRLKSSGCSTLQTWPHFSMISSRLKGPGPPARAPGRGTCDPPPHHVEGGMGRARSRK